MCKCKCIRMSVCVCVGSSRTIEYLIRNYRRANAGQQEDYSYNNEKVQRKWYRTHILILKCRPARQTFQGGPGI